MHYYTIIINIIDSINLLVFKQTPAENCLHLICVWKCFLKAELKLNNKLYGDFAD